MNKILLTKNFCISSAEKELLHDITFDVCENETVVLLGANGAGKSTLVRSIAGLDNLRVTGKLLYEQNDIKRLPCDERARKGIFLSYQEPVAIPGLSTSELLRSSLEARGCKMSLSKFKILLAEVAEKINISPFLAERDLGSNLSGGEKKKLELLQLLLLRPRLVMLDEIDSGLDIDATKTFSRVLADYQKETKSSFIIITHNMRILDELNVTKTICLKDGRIAKIGGTEIVDDIRKYGYKHATRT